ncbi:MAG: hypothetical protein Q4A60_00870 [Pasteurellaceae bacterium]|nr:hypothetical protein [Pasteurellaceae bacterium]
MRYFLFLLLFSPCSLADPFYAETPNETKTQPHHFADFPPDLPPCKPSETVEKIYLPLDFNQLTLVGLLNIKDQPKALFVDKQNKLIDLKENDFVVSAQIQIKKIDLKSVMMIDWKNSPLCHEPNKIQLKL